MTPADAVVRAHRRWVEGKRTGTLKFLYRHGSLKRIEHDEVEFLDSPAIGPGDGPACPSCGQPMMPRDGGAMWRCDGCGVKRTETQLQR